MAKNDDKNALVVKSNALIEQAAYQMKLSEKRIILLALTRERTNRVEGRPGLIKITAAEYAEAFDVPLNQAYEDIKDAVLHLYERSVKLLIDATGKALPNPESTRWITTKSDYVKDGAIAFKFNADLEPYLAVLKDNFARYTLGKIARMSSLHAIRIYELLICWGQDFRIHQKEIELAWLKKILHLEAQYEAIKDFKNRVLDPSIEQINEFTDISCSYEQKRTGRTITHLIFNFGPKEVPKPVETTPKTTPARKSTTPALRRNQSKLAPTTAAPPLAPGKVVCKKCGLHISEDLRQCPDCGQPKTPAKLTRSEIAEIIAGAKKALGGSRTAAAKQPENINPTPKTREQLIEELKALGWVEPQPAMA